MKKRPQPPYDDYDSRQDYNKPIQNELIYETKSESKMKYHHPRPIAAYTYLDYPIEEILPLSGYQPFLKFVSPGKYFGEQIHLLTSGSADIIGRTDGKNGVTINVPDPEISDTHLLLEYYKKNCYLIKDLGSELGSWVTLTMNAPNEISLNTYYKNGDFLFMFLQGPQINELEEFLDMMDLVHITDDLYTNNIRSFTELMNIDQKVWEALPISIQDKRQLYEHLRKLTASLSKDYHDHRIVMKAIQAKKEQLIEFGLAGIRVGYSNKCDYRLQKPEKIDREIEFVVRYMAGRYYIVPLGDRILRVLEHTEEYFLKPGVTLELGSSQLEYNMLEIYSVNSMGRRISNEDRLIIRQELPVSEKINCSVFCVIDGQGGDECASYIEENLIHYLTKNIGTSLDQSPNIFETLQGAIKKTFIDLDSTFYTTNPQLALTCGATICGIIMLGEVVVSFNLGDCRCVVVRGDSFARLTNDHVPTRQDEKQRIENVGGQVINGKLNGKVTISRCFGQFEYKETKQEKRLKLFKDPENAELLTCIPEILVYFIDQSQDNLILLYSDGIYQAFQEERMLNYLQTKAKSGRSKDLEDGLNIIAKEAVDIDHKCDNITIILIKVPKV